MSLAGADPALDALFLPLDGGEVEAPAERGILFLRARAGRWLTAWPRRDIRCVQTFKPLHDELAEAGAAMLDSLDDDARFRLVFVLPPRQREESRALLARALRHARAGGTVVAAVANNEGARSAQSDLEHLAGPVQSLSKHKCRVFWASAGDDVDWPLVDAWAALDAPRAIAEGRFISRPGLFAWDRIDAASALLAARLPSSLSGRVADLGAGYGYLSCELLRRCAGVRSIDLYEAEQRAIESARANLANAQRDNARAASCAVHWHDVTQGIPGTYDAIVSNPPFHLGRADRPELGQAFIAAAADALEPGGSLWLVANRHLPYEALIARRFADVRSVAVQDGFKVISASAVRTRK